MTSSKPGILEEAMALCNEGAHLLQSSMLPEAIAVFRSSLDLWNELAPMRTVDDVCGPHIRLSPSSSLSQFHDTAFFVFDRPFRIEGSGDAVIEKAVAAVLFNMGLCFHCMKTSASARKAALFYQLCSRMTITDDGGIVGLSLTSKKLSGDLPAIVWFLSLFSSPYVSMVIPISSSRSPI